MPTLNLIISPIAITDLKKIVKFGESNRGKLKSKKYLENLKNQFQQLMEHSKSGVSRDDIFPEIRSLTVESHVIFYLIQKKQIETIRVLHGRQDLKRHM